ncbi:hypothetical protein QBC43DRAFT_322477 [Cladorrhinum sp. PSN259]|nr:hypothetical protein QBC43DRAFT_322477 [Cladorrhinum sp. PSN259]
MATLKSPGNSGPGPRSLADMCIALAVSNIRLISGIGNMPSQYVGRIIKAVRDPAQLRALEENSEEIGEDIYEQTAEQWQRLIGKNFVGLSMKHNFVPEEPRHWHKIYSKYARMQEEINAHSIEVLVNRVAEKRAEKESRRAKILTINDTRRLPVPRSQLQRTTGISTHWSNQPRPKQTFLAKAKRQAVTTAQRFKQPSMGPRVAVPFGKVAKAPEAMINDARISKQFDPRTAPVRIQPPKFSAGSSSSNPEHSEREARLLQIKSKTAAAKKATVLSFNEDEDDFDDLFGDKEPDNSRQGVLSVDSLEDIDFSSKTVSSNSAAKRRPGLLSAAPGANRTSSISRSPSKPPFSNVSPPLRPATMSTFSRTNPNKTSAGSALSQPSAISGASGSTMSAAEAAAAVARRESSAQEAEMARLAALRKRRAQPVDVFMRRPNKKRA